MTRVLSILLLAPLLFSRAVHAETIIKEEFGCLHLKTLKQFDQRARMGERQIGYTGDQIKSGECSNFKTGTSVRIYKRIKTSFCVVPIGSFEACRWIASEVVSER
jgi:hypothetical protein